MKKRNYRAKKANQINWTQIKEKLSGAAVVFAVDVAKEKQYALLTNEDKTVSAPLYWNHPEQTPEMLTHLTALATPVTVVMESTGTYGDALRYQCQRAGFDIYQVSAKRVSDAREVYDGVPSMHDAKAVTVITQLHRAQVSHPWRELSEEERSLDALRREYDMHQSQYQRNKNRLEAYLSRHWPEVCYLLPFDSVTLESLLIEYGSPQQIAANAQAAAQKMRLWGRSQLSGEKIDQVIASAGQTLGQPCIEVERHYLQALAEEMRHSRLRQKQSKQALEAAINSDKELREVGLLIGMVTTAVLLSCNLDPRKYNCARSYQKALGLNLKEKSSGRHIRQLKLTKRGISIARKYLYFAALRLIKTHPVVKAWYQKKVDPRAKKKTIVALLGGTQVGEWKAH
ncbi:MAG: IS110 family transposase [Ketobacter sp.]|nr:IS110 family transposase [Ketobacter sp.]